VLAAREMRIFHVVSFDDDFDEVEGIDRIGKP
jgi:predicted nucleic acid-binding protein